MKVVCLLSCGGYSYTYLYVKKPTPAISKVLPRYQISNSIICCSALTQSLRARKISNVDSASVLLLGAQHCCAASGASFDTIE